MKQVLIKGGGVVVESVPAPRVSPKNVLVKVAYSSISAGTELAGVAVSGMPLYRRALKQPENVKRVLDMVSDQGLRRTVSRVRGKLAGGAPTGYSAAGTVIDVGTEVDIFAVGDRVACAGAGIANHAEVIDVPVNLAVHVPDEVPLTQASTVTLGAIALQGVRRADPTLGEIVVVVGLGVLGQITVQLLRANGCRVIGVDVDDDRMALATEHGAADVIDPTKTNYPDAVRRLTEGFGADAVIVTAASSDDGVISEAFKACRRKARVVLVGDVGLDLQRSDIYAKELDFLVSTSYGPGRYDPSYEEGGQDYPLPYVRWTENRNMATYLDLVARGHVNLSRLVGDAVDVDHAPDAYAALAEGSRSRLISLLSYPGQDEVARTVTVTRRPARRRSAIRVGVAGAGGFAQGMHLPNLVKLRGDFTIHAVMSRTGSNAHATARQYDAAYATTDYEALLADDDVDLVMITTRHDLHGPMVTAALAAGKHVFVEKPLALNEDELDAIESFYRQQPGDGPLLMTGFNRRFSPAVVAAQELLRGRSTPMMASYRMNAGFIPPEHWVHSAEGGGRNLGEACHIYDTFRSLTGSPVQSVTAMAAHPGQRPWKRNDNFTATVTYRDGSVCTLLYTAFGSSGHPKERMDVFFDGKVLELDDYRSLRVSGIDSPGWSAGTPDKGQLDELKALATSLRDGSPWPIALDEQLETSRLALHIESLIHDPADGEVV